MPCASVVRIAFISGLGALTGQIFADTVKLVGKPAFQNVRITNFTRGTVVFQGVSREFLRKPLSDVEWLEFDALPDLGTAEHAAVRGETDAALAAYRAARERASDDWLKALITARMAEFCDAAGRFADAVALYLDLLAGDDDPPISPRHPGPPGSAENARAIKLLREQLADAARGPRRDRLTNLLVELEIVERPDVSVADLISQKAEPAAESRPALSPILGLPVASQPAERKRDEFRLQPNALLLDVADAALRDHDAGRARVLIEAALPLLDGADRPRAALLFGRAQVELGQHAAAADGLLKLAAAAGESALAAEALYYAGVAQEGLGQLDSARMQYHEVLKRAAASQALRAAAREGLARVGE